MSNEIDRLLKNSDKAEFLEDIANNLTDDGKAFIILFKKDKKDEFMTYTTNFGVDNACELLVMLEMAKRHVNFCLWSKPI
ncbi:MAG: hypothetical protein A2Y89_03075 [Chloroflexi bacterium RBG_13_51_18]|nr:MAG: hypothetical protein A2Y89_03075 [Chloroflexi bacterium RBG_13_51_18]